MRNGRGWNRCCLRLRRWAAGRDGRCARSSTRSSTSCVAVSRVPRILGAVLLGVGQNQVGAQSGDTVQVGRLGPAHLGDCRCLRWIDAKRRPPHDVVAYAEVEQRFSCAGYKGNDAHPLLALDLLLQVQLEDFGGLAHRVVFAAFPRNPGVPRHRVDLDQVQRRGARLASAPIAIEGWSDGGVR